MSGQPDEMALKLLEDLGAKEPHAREHGWLVSRAAVTLAQELGLTEEAVDLVAVAGLLHDVGKVAVDEKTLLKPSRLSQEEFDQVKCHPEVGANIVRSYSSLKDTAEAILHHHERWDGRGYPFGKAKSDIPLEGRLLLVAETFSSLTQDQPFRQAMSISDAVMRLKWAANAHLDPSLVEAFLAGLKRLLAAEDLQALRETCNIDEMIKARVESLKGGFISVTQPILWEFKRLVGVEVFEEFAKSVNEFFATHRLPVTLREGRIIDETSWRSNPAELADVYRLALAHVVGSIRRLLGREYTRYWLRYLLDGCPNSQRDACLHYRLCENFL